MIANLLILPLFLPFIGAAVSLLFRTNKKVQRLSSLISSGGIALVGVILLNRVLRNGPLVLNVGNWPAPFGITFVADLLSAILVILTGIVGLCVVLYSFVAINEQRERYGYYPLVQILLMGVSGAFLTGDIFNMYVWFEVLLIASFVLLALGSERAQMEGAIKYVTINLISSMLFLVAVGLLYAEVGTLNMAHLAVVLPSAPNSGLIVAIASMFLIAFGIKAAMFPLYFWLPAAYHTPPPAVSALFAGLLTKVGVYALLRTFTLIFVIDIPYTHLIVLIASGITMVVGVLGALAQTEVRRILSFLIVSHIGFAVMGLGLYTAQGLAGAVFYLIEDMLVLTALFIASGVIRQSSTSDDLYELGGFYKASPIFALLFFVPALSLSGVPPFSGFFAKLALLQASIEIGAYGIVMAAIVTSILSLLAVTRIWSEVFWKPNPRPKPIRVPDFSLSNLPIWGPLIGLAASLFILGVVIGPVFAISSQAGQQLYDPSLYIQAVLGENL